ncbi:hypothetical protein, partial [Mesorhizobium sp.]|uniref:hypothetical protein n=1 Tax=Mesorhizobium sp. TaxID=1871066 RepID=UPI00257BBA0C
PTPGGLGSRPPHPKIANFQFFDFFAFGRARAGNVRRLYELAPGRAISGGRPACRALGEGRTPVAGFCASSSHQAEPAGSLPR